MGRLGEILAKNLKENRRKCGLTQAGLAEKVNVSTHHIAMIELSRHNPTLDLVERFANALDIAGYELFVEPDSPDEELERLRQRIRDDTKQLFEEFIGKPSEGKRKNQSDC